MDSDDLQEYLYIKEYIVYILCYKQQINTFVEKPCAWC